MQFLFLFLNRCASWARISLPGACLVLGVSAAHSAENASLRLSFPRDRPISASITLLQFDGKVGRSNPISSGYRPQFQMAGGKREVLCAVNIVPPKEEVAPGDTAAVTLLCKEDLTISDKDLDFVVTEGGRKVAEGAFKP